MLIAGGAGAIILAAALLLHRREAARRRQVFGALTRHEPPTRTYQTTLQPARNEPSIAAVPPGEQLHIPRRASTVAADVVVPLLQAFIEAALLALTLVLCVGCLDFVIRPGQWLPLAVYPLVFLFVLLIGTLYRWGGHLAQARSTAFEYRRTIAVDANRDGVLQPEEVLRPLYVDSVTVPIPDPATAQHTAKLRRFIADCRRYGTDIRQLAQYGWATDWSAFVGYLVANGAGRWRNPRAHQVGWDLADESAVERVVTRTIWVQ